MDTSPIRLQKGRALGWVGVSRHRTETVGRHFCHAFRAERVNVGRISEARPGSEFQAV